MNQETRRKIDNLLLSTTLDQIHGKEELHYLASLIVDHTHLREVIMTESDHKERYLKFEAMRPYLSFQAKSLSWYEYLSRRMGESFAAHSFDSERASVESKKYPESRLEVTNA